MCKNVHSSSIRHSPKLEITRVPVGTGTGMLRCLHTVEIIQQLNKPALYGTVWAALSNTAGVKLTVHFHAHRVQNRTN